MLRGKQAGHLRQCAGTRQAVEAYGGLKPYLSVTLDAERK